MIEKALIYGLPTPLGFFYTKKVKTVYKTGYEQVLKQNTHCKYRKYYCNECSAVALILYS